MIPQINKIYINSPVKINSNTMPLLCFVDGKLIDRSLFSLVNRELNIYVESEEYLTLSYGNNDAVVYEYNVVLDDFGVIIEKYDNRGNWLQNLKFGQLLVFVDGRLLDDSEYEFIGMANSKVAIAYQSQTIQSANVDIETLEGLIGNISNRQFKFIYDGSNEQWILSATQEAVDLAAYGITIEVEEGESPADGDTLTVSYSAPVGSEAIALKVSYKDNKFHNVVIYSCKYSFESGIIPAHSGETIEFKYDRDRHLIFKNGYLIPNNCIYIDTDGKSIIINYPIKDGDLIQYVKLPTKNQTINFATEKGFLTYGPEDDYKKPVPLYYDCELVFKDNVANLVDDIRTGFIFREDTYETELLIVDDNFNKPNIKALTINQNTRVSYNQDEYYLLVPECKKITDYLSDFDKKGTIIPEILEVFQRFLLDEYHDEIQRLRNIRNISKVDSLHINKLLKLLGNQIDLKNKTLQQKRDLLEELSSFYRAVGTKDSYNVFNVVDSDIGLANIEQLFTIRNNATAEADKKYTKITQYLSNGGSGYTTGDIYLLTDLQNNETPVRVKVTNTDDNGSILGLAPQVEETVGEIQIEDGLYNIVEPGQDARFNISSIPSVFEYSISPEDIQDPDEIIKAGTSVSCETPAYPGDIIITRDGTDNTLKAKLSIKEGNNKIGSGDEWFPLSVRANNIPATVSCYTEQIGDYLFNNSVPNNSPYSLTLEPGVYFYEMSGGGGSGGAADSTTGSTADITSTDGSDGELVTGVLYIPQLSNVQIYVGGGGQPSYARGHEPYYAGAAGAGYGSPQTGVTTRKSWTRQEWVHYWHHLHRKSRLDTITEYDTIASGSGGGASAILVNGIVKKVAKGGKGGDAIADHADPKKIYYGGEGGGGYYQSSTSGGAKGGPHSIADGRFISKAGQDGWVRIKRGKVNYILSIDNVIQENITLGSKYKTTIFGDSFPSFIDIQQTVGDTLKNLSLDRETFIAKVSPTEEKEYNFIYNGFWELDGERVRLADYGIDYDEDSGESGASVGDTITVHYVPTLQDFEVTITDYDPVRKIIKKYDYSPKEGMNYFSYRDGQLLINAENPGGSITTSLIRKDSTLSARIVSTPKQYKYNLSLYETEQLKSKNYSVGDVLYFVNSSYSNFKITVEDINLAGGITGFSYYPINDENPITAENLQTTKVGGHNGTVEIIAETQTIAEANILKEYVHFFNKEELGAEHKTEYRYPITDYGYVTEGTEHSPYPWTMGEADKDYGITKWEDGTIRVDADYGYVTEFIKGKWYQWWEWERDPNYYPTNHVEITINPKNTTLLKDILERFYSQFYKIASTVLYIHRIITNYTFGNKSIFAKNEDGTVNGAILCGFMTGQPIPYEKHFLTNDPNRQVRI